VEKKASLQLKAGNLWPYPWRVYLARALWLLVRSTLWPLCVDNRIGYLRPALLNLFGARVAMKVLICNGVEITFPWLFRAGHYVSIGPRARIYNLGGVTLGDQVIISQDAVLCGGTHDHRDPRMPLVRRPIVVGDQAWICAEAFIGPGVTIGEGAVVGARACVMKDVKPWTIVAGNPARVIGRRRLRTARPGRGKVAP
jgi:putative colanic acid biosynthesis acetyltransferase WcaF